MPAKWQQWMPFHIDRFFGSPSVRAMHPAAQLGYLALLASSWQSEDCAVPNDPIQLAEKSALGDELWGIHGSRILRKFDAVNGNGRLRNAVCYVEWQEAKRIFEARQASANRTNTVRSVDGHRTVTVGIPSRSPDTRTGTVTDTKTEEQKPSPKPRKRVSEGRKKKELTARPTKTDFDKARHREFKTAVFEYWQSKNSIDCPWGQPEGMQLEIWLKANPTIVIGEFKAILRNRYKSDVVHSERPSKWLRNATDYANGPLNQYNKPMTNGKNGGFLGKGDRNIAALNEALSGSGFSVDQNSTGTDGDSEGGDGGRFDFKSLLSAPGQRTT
jgi:hypothetical protein